MFFGRTAEIARDYLRKGSPAYIEGRLRNHTWTDKKGIEHKTTEIYGETLQVIGGREDARDAESKSAPRGSYGSKGAYTRSQ